MRRASGISTAKVEPSGSVNPGEHLIATVQGPRPGPTLIIVGGIHGNEPAGVIAAERVLQSIEQRKVNLSGEIVLLRGNTRALRQRVRYIDTDLNRRWTTDNVRLSELAENGGRSESSEEIDRRELVAALREVVGRARGEIYFVDLHTTSAQGKPFATVGDTLRNRRFALSFPVTIVLGLEEQIDGTLLEYLNNLGAITMGFEAGQHDAVTSIDNHEAVIWHATVATGNLRRTDLPELDDCRSVLTRASGGWRVVEVRHRHAIVPADNFKMEPGYWNFQAVRVGQVLAEDRSGKITALESGLILMPLYQRLGDDGFFLGREVKQFWLYLSALLRKLRVGRAIHLLPGVRRDPLDENVLIINTRIARILPLQIFHLLGFRRRRWMDNNLVVSRRAYDLAGPVKLNL
jgi:succinylglutamate desuccinylase